MCFSSFGDDLIAVPGPVKPPTLVSVNQTGAVIDWEEPDDPNGVVTEYLIEYSALDFVEEPYAGNKRSINQDLLKCFVHLGRDDTVVEVMAQTTEVTISNLRKFITCIRFLIT